MKKSEYVGRLVLENGLSMRQASDAATMAALAFNRTWDPEEAPLAARLDAANCGTYATLFADVGTGCTRAMTMAEAQLAADLYNRRKAIEEVAAALREHSRQVPLLTTLWLSKRMLHLADLLEGK